MEELFGYAVPMADLPLDHTYVVSSAGDRWECKGRDRGGRIICRGSGDLRLAKCLARPDGRAGIAYGITRSPLGSSTPQASWLSRQRAITDRSDTSDMLGWISDLEPYWPERGPCLDKAAGRELREAAGGFTDGLREPEATAYAMQRDPFVEQSVQRMNLLLDRKLAGGLDPGVRARVQQIVAATAAKQRELVLAFESGEITPQAYLSEFNHLVAADFRRIDEVLGRHAFLAVFGEPPEAATRIIDPKAFAAAHGLEVPPERD